MNTQPSGTIDTAKRKIVAAVKGAGDIVQTTMDAVVKIIGTPVKEPNACPYQATDVGPSQRIGEDPRLRREDFRSYSMFRGKETERRQGYAVRRIKIGMALALLTTVVGCVGYVGGGYGEVIVPLPPPPEVVLFGGGFERGHDVHEYSRRGGESRESAHHDEGDHGRRR